MTVVRMIEVIAPTINIVVITAITSIALYLIFTGSFLQPRVNDFILGEKSISNFGTRLVPRWNLNERYIASGIKPAQVRLPNRRDNVSILDVQATKKTLVLADKRHVKPYACHQYGSPTVESP